MKQFITVIALMALLTACTNSTNSYKNKLEEILGKKEIILITSPDYAPYEFIDPNKSGQDQYVGADIALGQYIADQLGVTLKIEAMDFDAVLAGIAQGKGDIAISGLGYKPERAETMELSKPYNVSEDNCHGLLVKQANNVQSLDELAGNKIAAQNASLQQGYTEDQISDANIELISNLNDGILMLQTDKVVALAIACKTGEQYAKSYPGLTMADATFDVSNSNSGTVIGIAKGQVELLEKINELIDEVIAKGLYASWEAQYTEYADSLGE